MSQRLHCVLSGADLPTAELWAAKLDGELVPLGDCFTPIDEVEQPVHRARVVHSALSAPRHSVNRLIAEQWSAAWIWGALEWAPQRHQFSAGGSSRAGRDLPRAVSVREVVIAPDEIAILGGLRVTTVLRTIIDLARFSEAFEPDDARIVATLMRSAGLTPETCAVAIHRRRNLPGKHRALERLSRC